ncbi:MAG: radical SAM protein [Sulfolobaceae archaeon]
MLDFLQNQSKLLSLDPKIPHIVELQLTYDCNLRCPYCFNPTHMDRKKLSIEEWKSIIKQVVELGTKILIFTGGEPLKYEGVIELIKYAKSFNTITALSSNGLLLNENGIKIIRDYLDLMQLSLHVYRYANSDDYNIFRNLEYFYKKIILFKEKEGEHKAAIFHLSIYANLYEKLKKILKLIIELDAKYRKLDALIIQPVLPAGFAYKNPKIIPKFKEIIQINEIVSDLEAEYNRHISFKIINRAKDYFKVKPNIWGYYGMIINPEGYVLPLVESADTLLYEGVIKFDNVRENSIDKIWKNSVALNMFRQNDWFKEPCISCEFVEKCRGGSRVFAYLFLNDIYAPDPFCPKTLRD